MQYLHVQGRTTVQEICFINEKLWINWKNNHKLRKNLSLRLDSKHLQFYLTQFFNNFQIQSICKFKNNIKCLLHYQNYFKNYTRLKVWLSIYSQFIVLGPENNIPLRLSSGPPPFSSSEKEKPNCHNNITYLY